MLTTVNNDLQRSTPENQGIASSAILQFVEAVERQIHELHSFILLRHGKVVAEGWWSPYDANHPHQLFSLSKSFTSTAVGLAIQEGHFSLDDRVLSFFPDDAPAEVNEYLAAMRVRHLLSMSTGHVDDTYASMTGRADGDWIRAFFEVPVLREPGTHFLYNTGATYMLSAIVQKTTGLKVVDYLAPRLFQPLGIENAAWEESPQGINVGGIGLSLRTEDIARFGQLYLQKGMWEGRAVLPEAWVNQATSVQISNGDEAQSDWTQGYGYQFWRCRHGAYRGDGVFGQYCIVMPEQDAVLAMTGGMDVFDMQEPLNLVWDILLPAMGDAPLAEDVGAYDTLTKKLSSLSLPPVQGQAASPTASQVSGQLYSVDANELNIETIALSFTEAGCTVTMKIAGREEIIPCGYGLWEQSQTALFNESELTKIAVSGAWTDTDTFTMVMRLYETPFSHTFEYHFAANEMIIETWVNYSLEAVERILLTAHSM